MSSARRTTTPAQRVAAVVVGVLLALPLAVAALLATAVPAQAATYRYWTYWWGSSTGKSGPGWTFAKVGPAGHGLKEGWVLGWRFATTSTVGGTPPRQQSDFSTLCPGVTPAAGVVHVAVVVDYGTAADAPPGQQPPTTTSVRVECITVDVPPTVVAAPTGATALRVAQVSVRDENGLICALDGYPKGECAPVVVDPSPASASATPRPASSARSSSSPGARSSVVAASASRSSTATPSGTPAVTVSTDGSGSSTSGPSTAAATSSDLAEPLLAARAGAPLPADDAGGSPAGLLVGGAVVAAVAGSAWWTSRRRGVR